MGGINLHKVERLMAIILALSDKDKITAKELADKFEVNIRTIYRDIEALSQMDIPIVAHFGNEGGYSLLKEYFIPPVVFNKEEILSLLLSQKLIDIVNMPGYNKYSNTAFLKIRKLMNQEMKSQLNKIEEKIIFEIQNKTPEIENSKVFDSVKKALEGNFKIHIEYFNPHKLEDTTRIVCPYGLIFEDGVWYLIALCELRNEMRWFRVDRIKEISITRESFEVPETFDINDFGVKGTYSNIENLENAYIVKLKLTKELFHIVKDYYYFKYGEVVEKEEYYIINIKTDRPQKYISLGFKFYDGMEILEPEWLREEFKDETKTLYEKYI